MAIDFPPELWFNICNLLPQNNGKDACLRYSTLRSLCQTSKALCAIAQPVLWSKFTNRWDDDYQESRGFLQFTQCCLEHPKLAKYVRELDLTSGSFQHADIPTVCVQAKKAGMKPFGPNDFRKSQLQSSKSDEDEESSSVSSNGTVRVGQVLRDYLSFLVPNLERVNLVITHRDDFSSEGTSENVKRSFPNLGEIYLSYWDEQDGFEVDRVTDLLSLPTLQIATMHQAVGMDTNKNVSDNKTLKHLRFVESVLSKEHISKLAAAYSHLETLEYHAGHVQILQDSDVEQFTAKELVTALKPVAGHLKNLMLDLSDAFHREEGRDHDSALGKITSYKSLKALKRLDVDATSVLGGLTHELEEQDMSRAVAQADMTLEEVFPPSLIDLKLINVYRCFAGPMQWLATNVKDQLPNLVSFHLGFSEVEHELGDKCESLIERYTEAPYSEGQPKRTLSRVTLPEDWQTVISTFEQAGVRVSIEWTENQEVPFEKAMFRAPFDIWVKDSTFGFCTDLK